MHHKANRHLNEFENDLRTVNNPMPRWLLISNIILQPSRTYGYEKRSEVLNVIATRKDTPGFILGDLVKVATYRKDDPLISNIVSHQNANKIVFNHALRYLKDEFSEYVSLIRENPTKPPKNYNVNFAEGSLDVDSYAYWTIILASISKHKNAKIRIRKEAAEFSRISGF